MRNQPDEILVSMYAQGEDQAFDELLRRYKQKLYNYIYQVVQNREVAEDIFQDTFTKVIVNIRQNRYQEMGRFVGFIFRVAHNLIIDYYRQEQLANTLADGDTGYDVFNNQDICESSFEDHIAESQILNDVRRLIRFLPANQQEIVQMRYYQNKSFKEIADLLGISINTALGRIHYAIINMRKMAMEHNIELTV